MNVIIAQHAIEKVFVLLVWIIKPTEKIVNIHAKNVLKVSVILMVYVLIQKEIVLII